jgi:guanylate cyclase
VLPPTDTAGAAGASAAEERPAAGVAASRLRVPAAFAGLLRLGADEADHHDLAVRKALLVGVSLMVLPAGVAWGAVYWILDERLAALVPWTYAVLDVVALGVFARTHDLRLLRIAQLGLILVLPALLVVVLGGLSAASGVVLWSLLAPLGAVVFDRPARAWLWFAAFLGVMVASIVVAPLVRPEAADIPVDARSALAALNIAGVSLVAFTLLAVFARQRAEALQRVERLLLNILPDEIAERLKDEPGTLADHFEDVSVLFADVVDFTPLSSRLDPTELVEVLDALFTEFDRLADDHGVEKIKTIGDCYMVAAGVPSPRPDHAHALAEMALGMHECAARCLADHEARDLRLRIGISSGPVVAGVIGRRRFLYDLWGDTVNMASRMESHGVPGRVHITRATWERVRGDFRCERRGEVEVKGKGPVETWHLVGRHREGARA